MKAWLEPDEKRKGVAHFTSSNARLLVRAPYKKDLPSVGGAYASRFTCGSFEWKHWGIADQWGRFLTQEWLDAPKQII